LFTQWRSMVKQHSNESLQTYSYHSIAPDYFNNKNTMKTTAASKRSKKHKKKGAIPLVKHASASSLAKKKQVEANEANSGGLSRSRRRKRSRKIGGDKHNNLFSSTKESLEVISQFHTLNKRLEQNERDTTLSETDRQKIAQEIQKEQKALGGLDRYQKASIYGAKSSKFVCADWVVPLLKAKQKKGQQLRILDVGAIDHQYEKYKSWLDAVPIDLHGGQHDSVLPVDFFDYAHEYCTGTDLYNSHQNLKKNESTASPKTSTSTTTKPFDAIVLSLVLNFQGDPRKRGDMLCLAADLRLLADHGMLFVALPSASLENSRYCDLKRFIEVVTNPLFGLELLEQKISAKLVLLAFQKTISSKQTQCYNATQKTFDYGDHEMKRLPAKPGTKRNNFAVILKSSHNRT